MKRTLRWFLVLGLCLLVWPWPAQAQDSKLASVGFNLHGYYRVRYDNFFDLGWAAKDKDDDSNWWSWLDHRLVLQPTLIITDPLAIVMEMNLLDNVTWGDNEQIRVPVVETSRKPNDLESIDNVRFGTLDFDSGNLFSQSATYTNRNRDEVEPIEIKQLYLRAQLPIGYLRIGRQASHFGMGLFSNAGSPYSRFLEQPGDVFDRNSGFDSDGGDYYDRIMFATRVFDLWYPMLMYDRIAESSFKTGENDVHAVSLVNQFREIKFADSGKFDGGFAIQTRTQHATSANVWIYDLWLRLAYAGFTWEGEALALQGDAKFVDHDTVEELQESGLPTGEGGGEVRASAYLAAGRFNYSDNKWGIGFEYGFSSPKDPNPDNEFDPDAAANLDYAAKQLESDEDNAEAKIDFTNTVMKNQAAFGRKISTFAFDPEYNVDRIIWDQLMGGAVANGMYFKLAGFVKPLDGMHLQVEVIDSYINESWRAPDGGRAAHDLGWEADLNFGYTFFKHFTLDTEFAYALPGMYFRDVYEDVKNVYTIQLRSIVNF